MKSKVIKLIKKLIGEFVILIFILGFLSASLQNYLLPKVELTFPMGGYISRTVPINGQIVPKEVKKLKLASDAAIDEIYVFYGQRISKDTPLFKVRGKYQNIGNSLEDMRSELAILEKNLKLYGYQDGESVDSKLKEAREKLNFETSTLDGYKKMFESGAISKNTLMDKELEVESLKSQIKILTTTKNESSLNLQISKDKMKLEIDKLKKDIANIEDLDEFYLSVDEDNICRSDINGVVVGVYEVGRKGETVYEVAPMKDFSSVNYVALIDDELRDYIKPGYSIKLFREGVNLGKVCVIRSICEAAENGKLKVVAEFPSGMSGIPTINAPYDGMVEKKKKIKSRVKLSAVMPHDKLLPNRKASLFAVVEEHGVLTTVYRIKEVTVEIVDVGDNTVEISGGLDKGKYKGYVTNISNKIYDGVRVYSEEF